MAVYIAVVLTTMQVGLTPHAFADNDIFVSFLSATGELLQPQKGAAPSYSWQS